MAEVQRGDNAAIERRSRSHGRVASPLSPSLATPARPLRLPIVLALLAIGAALLLGPARASAAEALCTDTWVGPAEGNWQTPADWSTGQAPTSADVACIGAGDTVQVSSASNQAGLLQGEGAIVVSGATLELTNALETSSIASLTLSGGSLSLAGQLSVSSGFAASGDVSVSGAGSLVVGSRVSGTLGSGASCSVHLALSGVTFVNDGTLTFGAGADVGAGAIAMQEGAQLQNAGTFEDNSFDPGCGFGIGGENLSFYDTGGAASIANTGTFKAEAGGGALVVGVALDNQGSVEAASGTLQLAAGGSGASSTWSAASGAALAFTGGSFALDGDTWSGAGAIEVAGASVTAGAVKASGASVSLSSGTLTVPQGTTVSPASLALSGGTLSLAGQLSVSSGFAASGDVSVSGAGSLVVGSHVAGTLGSGASCSVHLSLSGATLVNDGTLTFGTGADVGAGAIAMQEGAQLQNAGTFDDNSTDPGCGFGIGGENLSIYDTGGAASITNTGTFDAEAASSVLVIGVQFNNEGTFEANSGTLQLAAGGSGASSTWSAAAGAALAFTGGSFALDGDTWSGAIDVAGAAVTATAVKASGASVSLSSGTLTVPQGTTVSPASLALSGGTLSLAGQLSVSSGFAASGDVSVSGAGSLVVGSHASGTLGSSASCSVHLALSGVTLVNDGTLTFGTGADVGAGAIAMQEGAQLQNAGTFDDNSTDPGCGFGIGGENLSIYDTGGAASITNTGTFKAEAGGGALAIGVVLDNQGSVEAASGTLQWAAGGSGTTSSTWSAAAGAALAFTGGSFALDGDTWSGAGTIEVAGAAVTATAVKASGANVSLSSGTLTVPQGTTVSPASLALSGGTLSLAGQLSVSSGFAASGNSNVSGAGSLVVGSHASGTLGSGASCSVHLALSGVTLVNDGTLTFGTGAGVGAGAIAMQEGAQLQNAGTFDDNSTDPGCGFGIGGENLSIYDTGGAASITNTGTFKAEAGGGTLVVGVVLTNQGTVESGSGTLQLDGNVSNPKRISIDAGAKLDVTGNYSQGENGTLKLGIASPTSFGVLSVDGTSALDGLLELTGANGFTAELGQTFAVLSTSGESGAFSFVGGSGVPSGAVYEPNYSNSGLTLLVANSEGQVPAPVLISPPSISGGGSPQQGQTLVLTQGTWEHDPGELIDQWLRCDAAGGECEPISGAGGEAYVLSRADVGHTIALQEIARNTGGDSAPARSNVTGVVSALPLHAVVGESVSADTGAKVSFDGSASTPAAEIESYRWQFGDGESAEGAVVHHVYRTPGTYTATLTISRGSEQSSQSLQVNVVTPPGAEHAAALTLTDSSHNPVSEVELLYVDANGTRTESTTNSRGEADLAGLPEGEDTVYAYKSGYRPATEIVDVDSEHQGFAEITLEPGEVATSGLRSHELSFSEIVEAGIDPSEPANQTVYHVEAALQFAGSVTIEIEGDVDSEGQFAGSPPTVENGKGEGQGHCNFPPGRNECETKVIVPEGNGASEELHIIAKPATIETHPVMQWLILRGSAVAVKQFFEVSMVVQNLSSEEPFGLTAGTADLNLPAGMSLAPTAEEQALAQPVEAIPPLGSATTHWVVRGDTPGSYTPSVEYNAQLEPFGTAVSTQAALAQPLQVWGANALSTVLKIDSGKAEPGIPYHVTLGVKNVSDIPLYNVSVNTSAPRHEHFILQPDQQFSASIGELRPGQTVFAPAYVLITQSPKEIYGEITEGKLIGESFAELQSVTLAGESGGAPATIERVSPPTLYEAKPSAVGSGKVDLQWQQVPGAEGYEIFSTPSLGTPFGSHPLADLSASASSAEVSGSDSEYFAVSTLIDGHLVLDHPLVEASRAGQEQKEKEEQEEREKEEEKERERERHEREKEAEREKHEGEENPSEPNRHHCKSGKDAVNCATGNHTETQTDLSVGGRGPALTLTRTYNSQQAARETKPGPFGYGWTGPGGAYATVSEWCSIKRSCGSRFAGSVTVHQANGATVFFSKSEGGGWTAGPLVQSTLSETGNQLIMRLPDGNTLSFNAAGHLSSHEGPLKFLRISEGSVPISGEADRNGNALSFAYNDAGQLTSIADASGRAVSFAYNSEGFVSSATDPMSHTVKYSYEKGNLVSVTEPGETAALWKFTYDSANEMTSETEGSSHTETTEYDSQHRVIAQTDAAGRKYAWKYTTNATGTQTTISEPNGSTTIEQFNSEDQPTAITRAAGTPQAVATFDEYNGEGQLIATTDPNGGETTYTYDAQGNRASERDPLGDTTRWTYNGEHEVIGETQPDGETTTITRDERGNEIEVSRPAPGGQTQTTKYTYDSAGDETSMTNPLGGKWTYTYDANGDRESETDPEGDKRTFSYDADSNPIAQVSPLGNVAGAAAAKFKTTFVRDARERVIETTNPLKDTTKTTYNAFGQVASTTDANKHTTSYSYDADGEPIKITEADGAVRETDYDAAGQPTAHIDADHHKTTYVRNALEQVIEEIDPLGHKTSKAYDADGNLIREVNPEGKTTTYTYDADNRLTKITYSDGKTAPVEYEYNDEGERTKMVDASGTTKYAYDQLGRLTESIDGHGDRTAYEYDLNSDQTKITYPNGKAVTHTFDGDGRLKSATDWLGNTTTFSYNADSDQTLTTFPHAGEETDEYTYNDADEITKTVMKKGKKTLASLSYTRAKNGEVTKTASKDLPGEASTAYTYDAADRLTKAGATAYEYDPAGNPTKIGTTTDTFNADDELTSTSSGQSYTYNEESERVKATPASGPATTYSYNQAGQQIAISRPGEGSQQPIEDTYVYDGDGLRVAQTVSGHTSYLTWTTTEAVPLLLSDGSNSYLYGPGELPVEQISSEGKVSYMHHDQQGSTRLLTSSTGAVEGTFTYGAYGSLTGSTGTATTPLGYDGQYTEAATGLIYLRARSYEPASAQFTSVDPAVSTTGAPYAYAADDPINRGDPSGLKSKAERAAEIVNEQLGKSVAEERRIYAERVEAEKDCDQALAEQKARELQAVKELRFSEIGELKRYYHEVDVEERDQRIVEWYEEITKYFATQYACAIPELATDPLDKAGVAIGTGTAGNLCDALFYPEEAE